MSATGAGAVNIRLGAITTDFLSAMKGVSGAVRNSVASMNNDLASFYKAQDRQRAVFSKGLGRLAADFQSVGRGLTVGLTGPLAIGLGMIASNYASISQLKNAGEAYGITLQDIQKIAKAPGLGLEEAAGSVVGLRAVQYDANLAKSAVMEFGNALTLAGKGKAELQGVSLAFQQIKSKGSIQAEEINQIAERMPQIRQIMKEAFGTADTQNLQKLGISADEFTTKVVTGLSKLPRAIVGPQVAWENFTDGLKIGYYEIGASADRLFGLTDKLSGLGDVLGDWAEKFKALPDSAQKAIFLVSGLAAAIGPLSIAVGSVIKLLPVLASGFGVVTGPVGIAVAAVAGAAALIIAHWDKLQVYWEAAKKAISDAGVWSTFSGLVSSAFDLVTGVFKTGIGLITATWNTFKGFLIPQAQFLFGTISEIFKGGAGILTGVFKVLTGLLTLDWSKLMEGLQNITASIWNGIIGLMSKSIVYVGSLFAAFVEQFGAKGFGDSIRAGLDGISASADKMKLSLAGAQKATTTIGTAKPAPVAGRTPALPVNPTFTRIPKAGKAEKTGLEKELDDVERRIKAFQDKYHEIEPPTFLRVRRAELRGWLGMKEDGRLDLPDPDAIGNQAEGYWKAVSKGWYLTAKKHFENLKLKLPELFAQSQEALQNAIQSTQSKKQANGGYDNVDAAIAGFGILANMNQFLNQTKESGTLGAAVAGFFNTEDMEKAFAAGKVGIAGVKTMADNMQTAVDGLTNGVRAVASEAFTGMFESIGAALGGSKDAFQKYGKGILGMIADLAIKIGKAMLMLAAPMMLSGIFSAEAIKNLAIGGALVVAGGAIKAIGGKEATAFANGGIVRGATLGLVGEYPSARTGNPEVISPLRTLKSMLSPLISQTIDDRLRKNSPIRPYTNLSPAAYTQRILVEGEFRAQGSELLTVLRRAEKSKINFG